MGVDHVLEHAYTVVKPSGQGRLGAHTPARGGRGPSMPDGPSGPLCGGPKAASSPSSALALR
eukprot:11945093-Alexandrium_andersonii.AAC.1